MHLVKKGGWIDFTIVRGEQKACALSFPGRASGEVSRGHEWIAKNPHGFEGE
jgi:hypothetical protein